MEGAEIEPTPISIKLLRGKAGVLLTVAILECPLFRRTPLIGLIEHSIWNGSGAMEMKGAAKPSSFSLERQNIGLASSRLGFPSWFHLFE